LEMRKFMVVGFLIITACSSGPQAPVISSLETVCNDRFCVDVPDGWDAEVGETYLSFHHSLDPNHTFLTVGVADMEAMVVASGGTWPVSAEEATRSFWALLEEVDVAEFKRSARLVGGAFKSWGTHVDGDMWYLLHPVEGSLGVAIEMRAPNSSWETHADAVFGSLVVKE
jgi:hypothetical protein